MKQFLVKSGTVFNRIRLEPPFDRLGDRCSIPSRLELIWTFARRAYLGRKSDRQLHMMDTLIIESGRGPRRINSRYARSNPLGGDPLSLNTRRLINLYRSFQFSRLKIFRDGRKYARYEKCLSPVITFAFLEKNVISSPYPISSVQIKQYIDIELSLVPFPRVESEMGDAIRIVFRPATIRRAIGRVTENILGSLIVYKSRQFDEDRL